MEKQSSFAVLIGSGVLAVAIVAAPFLSGYLQRGEHADLATPRYQISAYGWGAASERDITGRVAGDGVYVLDTQTGQIWHRSSNSLVDLGTPSNPLRRTIKIER